MGEPAMAVAAAVAAGSASALRFLPDAVTAEAVFLL